MLRTLTVEADRMTGARSANPVIRRITGSSGGDGCFDTVSSLGQVLVLPYAQYGPSVRAERPAVALVPFSGPGELGLPPVAVAARQAQVLRARVPKARVDEARDFCSSEHNIGPTPQ